MNKSKEPIIRPRKTPEEKQLVKEKRIYRLQSLKKKEEQEMKEGHRQIIFGDCPDELI